jgi:aspartate oxidase
MAEYDHDVLIIGSGAAGLGLSLQLAKHTRVAVLHSNVNGFFIS